MYLEHFQYSVLMQSCSFMPTFVGEGKTLVAARVIDHFLLSQPAKKAIFIVPSNPLVLQQAQQCQAQCDPRLSNAVATVNGESTRGWSAEHWQTCLQTHRILVGTPEVFRQALIDRGFITAEMLAVAVVDECHNATGNSSMVEVVRHLNARVGEARPRSVTLSAYLLRLS